MDAGRLRGREPAFSTDIGAAYCGDALDLLRSLPDESVSLVLTSPPYALHFKKAYGNVDQDEYVDWLLGFVPEIRRVTRGDGSFVLNLGGSWRKGSPTRSLCHRSQTAFAFGSAETPVARPLQVVARSAGRR
ncbi:MAG: hypothetical protein JXP73_06795 [Deltaproteobacteria bacterium]|nr:hypothetical protein [Deltaproteobacteria bacterium]